jgi:hypothetical protein
LVDATSSLFDIYSTTEEIPIVIHSIITPTHHDAQNNVLYIEHIDYFPENTVRLIDRWGVQVKSWSNFINYESSTPEQADFDFSSLNVGNYVCVVQYKDPNSGNSKSRSQMITVLK